MEKKAWKVTATAILSGIAIAIVQNKTIPCIDALQEYFSCSMTAASWISSIFCVMGIIVAFPAAIIVNKLGVRKVGILALTCAIVGSLLGIMSNNIVLLMFSRVVEGTGVGFITVAVPSLISMWFPTESRGLPMGVWSSWQFVAQAIVFFFGVSITTIYGWHGIWWFGNFFSVVALVMYLAFVYTPPADQSYADIEVGEKVSIIEGLKYKPVWLISFAMFCVNFSCFGFVTWVASCWSETLSVTLDAANKHISVMYLWELPIVIIIGKLLDKVNRKKYCTLTFACYIVVVGAAFLLPTSGCMIPYIIIYPLFEGSIITGLWTAITQTVSKSKYISVAIAFFTLLSNIGMLLGPVVTACFVQQGMWVYAAIPVSLSALAGTVATAATKLYAAN